MNEGALFRAQLGDAWESLHPNIRRRFDHDPAPGTTVNYRGHMTVHASRAGRWLAYLLQHTGALMPDCAANVPVDIAVWSESGRVYKRRVYHFSPQRQVVFASSMVTNASGVLLERVGGGFGLYVRVAVGDGDLLFRDAGYFFEWGRWQVPLPRWLAPGQVQLRHANRGPSDFVVVITITHPWFGVMYQQHGEFRHVVPD